MPVLSTGDTFAQRYKVVEHIGAGGMGDVYAAFDAELEETIALKILLPERQSSEWLSRFREEVRLARRVTHRNVARIFDIGSAGEKHYLTMELIHGESLRKKMRGAVALADAVFYARQLADGLRAAHDAGVVHGDLKPGNAMLEDGGRLALIDFGLAKAVDEGRDVTDVVLGTPSYMAPEQLQGRIAGAAADVYAFGLVLFELIAGERPFVGATGIERAKQRINNDAPDLRAFVRVPDVVADMVARCLSRDVGRRPKAAELAELLAELVVDPGAPTVDDQDPFRADVTAVVQAPQVAPFRVAVLPFRSSADHTLADGITDSLRELLALTSGLVVTPTEVARRAGQGGRLGGLELGVDAVVEGAVTRGEDNVRVAVRLVDVESGKELWHDELDGRVGDLLRVQDRAARRIAEELRVQITSDVYRHIVPDVAVDQYLRARTLCRMGPDANPAAAHDVMQGCIDIAPRFLLAQAARAIAAMRAAFVPRGDDRDWLEIARGAIEQALLVAADVPDTHLAAAMLAVHDVRYGDAIAALERALRLAPSFAEAHEQLGRLEVESGRLQDGCRRLFLAAELDPGCAGTLTYVVRAAWFRGRDDVARRTIRRIEAAPKLSLEYLLLRARAALWGIDVDLDRVRRDLARVELQPAHTLVAAMLAAVDGDTRPFDAFAERMIAAGRSRYGVLLHQLGAELHHDLEQLERADAAGLFDLEWLERCPALDVLRAQPRFLHVRDSVARRVLRL